MWLFAKDGFLSIVQHRDQPDVLMVRARVAGDIEHYFPDVTVIRKDDADYLYRAFIPRVKVADVVRDMVLNIPSGGFKSTIADKRREAYYLSVWDTMAEMQEELGQGESHG